MSHNELEKDYCYTIPREKSRENIRQWFGEKVQKVLIFCPTFCKKKCDSFLKCEVSDDDYPTQNQPISPGMLWDEVPQ